MEPFTKGVQEGVSSNLCSAIAEIGEKLDEGKIEISFSWARTRKKPQVVSSKILIPHSSVPFLREAARVLKETYRDDDFEVFGPVVRTESFDPSSGGDVWIYCDVVGYPRKVKFHLEEDYFKAVNAHRDDLMVSCRGRLEKEGRYWTLKGVREFQIIESVY